MKLLYSGQSFCDQPVFKRLLAIADEIHFMDRPSVIFGNWGTVGHDSFARQVDWSGSPVPIAAIEPPSGPAIELYGGFAEADINSEVFAKTVLEGFQSSDEFANKFIRFEADYGGPGRTGRELVRALREDPDLLNGGFDLHAGVKGMFDVSNSERRRETFKTILIEASINVTSAVLVAEKHDLHPISEDPYVSKLIGLRALTPTYLEGTSRAAPYIGLAMAEALLPDELLARVTILDIMKYREKTKATYEAWSAEINRVAAMVSANTDTPTRDDLARVIASELTPKIIDYRNEMAAIRDDLFADIVKKITRWEFPTISLAYLGNVGLAGGMVACVAALAPAIGPDVIDYFVKRRDISRRNAMAFLLGLSKE